MEITDLAEVGDRIKLREGDVLCVAHALILGKFHARERLMTDMAERGLSVSVAGGDPLDVAMAEARAEIHALAKRPTGIGTAKQKRNPGRPQKYPDPTDDQMALLRSWWAGPLHWQDVAALAGEMLKCETPDRNWVNRTLGKRPPHPKRARKTRSDKGVSKSGGSA